MYCINCGGEIKPEFNNCPYCGKPVQIVPNYTIYDENDINLVLENSIDVPKAKAEHTPTNNGKKAKQDRTTKTLIIIASICVVLLLGAIVVKVGIDLSNASSYEYQMKMADGAMFKMDYGQAETYYLNALNLKPADINVRLELADLYVKKQDTKLAIKYLNEIILIDKNHYDAHKKLIKIYKEADDLASILALKENVTNEQILNLFTDYIVNTPHIELEGGNYSDEIEINLTANKGLTIYYTLDGSDPKQKGEQYTSAIVLNEEGTHTLKVVAKNSSGAYSEVISETYVIALSVPLDPVVTPDFEDYTIEIEIPQDCSAYYTWDNTDPTDESDKYTKPIQIPEGENILSVIIINDKTGAKSFIYRNSFEYYPE